MTPAFTKIEGTSFYHVFDGRNRMMRVRLKPREDGSMTVSRFSANRNIKLAEGFLENDAVTLFNAAPINEKVKTLFKLVER